MLGLAVGTVALLLLLTLARQASTLVPGAARPDDVLLVLLAWTGVGLAAWLVLGSLLSALALLPGAAGRLAAEVAQRVTPLAVRRALTFVLGAAVGSCALPAAPVANAASAPVAAGSDRLGRLPGATRGGPTPGFTPTDGPDLDLSSNGAAPSRSRLGEGPGFLPTPGQPGTSHPGPAPAHLTAPAPAPGPGYLPTAPPPVHDADRPHLLAPVPRVAVSTHDLVTIHRGDSLWSLAARHLGPGASDAQVAHEWPRWYAANRAVIGEDPDVLVPGQQLRPPSAVDDRSTGATVPGATVPGATAPGATAVAPGARR
ncbi:hypothetical protein LQK93_00632 [Terrabacter sp. BE26]